jgi:LmbE family N-acetylglucosaminyl deacetylase
MDNSSKTILAVLAHPDDESFGMGGTLALYAQGGHNVYLVCATRGEVGTVDAEHMHHFNTIAELREAELRCAAEYLGLKQVYFLGYRDSGMPGSADNSHVDAQVAHPVDEVAGRVVHYIRELKPDVVITFDPIGGYRHPDHIHIQQATALAFEKAGDSSFHPESGSPFKPRALYFQIFSRGFLRFVTRIMPLVGMDPRRFGRNKDIDLKSLTDVTFPVHARIDVAPVRAAKDAAGLCHASQGGMTLRRGPLGFILRVFGEYEEYMRAYPPVQNGHRVVQDLLDGI